MNTTLKQLQSHLLYWAKFACEEEGARYDGEDDLTPPSWLAELRAVCDAVEDEGGEAVEP